VVQGAGAEYPAWIPLPQTGRKTYPRQRGSGSPSSGEQHPVRLP
jgi:hypothetical protein